LYEAIKDGVEVARKADNIEVMKQLLDAQKEALDLLDQNRALRERIRTLEEKAQIQGSLIFRDNKYWVGRLNQTDGPYCTTCWDVDGRLVRMLTGDFEIRYCNFCTYHRSKPKR